VSVIDTETNKVTDTITVSPFPHWGGVRYVEGFGNPTYVTNSGGTTVSVIDIFPQYAPRNLRFPLLSATDRKGWRSASDGTHAYVANFGGTTVSVLTDTGSARVLLFHDRAYNPLFYVPPTTVRSGLDWRGGRWRR